MGTTARVDAQSIKRSLACSNSACECHRGPNTHCPGHDDKRPSLTVHESPDATVLVNCKFGCSQEKVISALKERGLWVDTASRERDNGKVDLPVTEPVAVYEYRDVGGELVAVKGRFEYPDGHKVFAWKLPGVVGWARKDMGLKGLPMSEMPLWGAELVAATAPDERAYLVEGEKATMACRAVGLFALTHGGGASTHDFGSSLEVLRGRNVVLWPDNDEPGRKLMGRMSSALRAIARSAVTIFPPVPERGDAVEYFGRGGTLEALAALVPPPPRPVMEYLDPGESEGCLFQKNGLGYAAHFSESKALITIDHLRRSSGEMRGEVLVETAMPTIPRHLYWGSLILSSGANREKLAAILGKRTQGLGIDWDGIVEVVCRKVALAERAGEPFQTAGDGATPLQPTDWLVTNFCPRGEPTIIFGDGGAGKSTLSLAMGIAVITGLEVVPGYAPVRTGNVLYLDWEATQTRLDSRIKRICKGLDIPPVRLGYRRCVVPMADQVEDVLRYCQSEGVVLAIIDSTELAMNGTGGDSSDPNDKVIKLHSALRLLDTTNILVDHISAEGKYKPGGAGKPIGGMFKQNLARMAHELRRSQTAVKPSEASVGLFNTKRNDDGALLPPVGLRVEFGLDWTRYHREGITDVTPGSGLSVRERMALVLRKGAMGRKDLALEVGATENAVKVELSRWKGLQFVAVGDGKWGLKDHLTPTIEPEEPEGIPF